MRVVSLVPSVTETLLAWGVTPIGVTRFCRQPGLPAVGGTKDPDVGAIAALVPDVVILNDEENRREDADALAAAGVAVHVVTIESVADVAPQLGALRARLGLPPEPAAVATSAAAPCTTPPLLRVFVPIWRRPWMTVNGRTYGSSLLAAAGAANVFADAPDRYPTVTLDEAAARAPHLVLAPSEPYPFSERQRGELESVAPVVFVDGEDLFWWGARTPAALARLGEICRQLGARVGP